MKKISMKRSNPEVVFDIPRVLKALEPIVFPEPQILAEERKVFISLVEQNLPAPVSLPLVVRIKQMSEQIFPRFANGQNTPRKERFVMSTALARIFIIAGLIFTLATGTIVSAFTSLPDSPLYDVKLTMEDFSLKMLDDPARIANKHLTLAHNRITEMVKQTQQGDLPDGGTLTRLKQHLAFALHFAAQVQAAEMQQILVQAQTMAQNQIQTMAQVQAQTGENPEGPLGTATQMMTQFVFQLQFGLGDPAEFRVQHQKGPNLASLDPSNQTDETTPIGDENKYGQQSDQPGTPGGNPDCDCCEPIGDELKYRYGQGDLADLTDQAENQQDCQICEPEGDEHKYGTVPGQTGSPGPGEPGGNEDCKDCDPVGDKNQNGQLPEDPPKGPGGDSDCPNCDCPDCPNCDPDCPNCDCDCDGDGSKNKNGNN